MPREAGTRYRTGTGASIRRRHGAVATHASAPSGPNRQATARATAKGEGPVLVAGGKPSSRAAVMRDLTETMPSNTRFDEARAAGELLALAPDSRMVVLSGDLGDISAKSAMHILAHHHPDVPVVRLDARA